MKYKRKRRGWCHPIIFHCSPARSFPIFFLPSFLPSVYLPILLFAFHAHASILLAVSLNLYYRLSYEERSCHEGTRSSWIIQLDRAICFVDSVEHYRRSSIASFFQPARVYATTRHCAKSAGKRTALLRRGSFTKRENSAVSINIESRKVETFGSSSSGYASPMPF